MITEIFLSVRMCGSVLDNLLLVGTGDGWIVWLGESGIERSFSRRFEIPSTREGVGRIRCLESLKGWGTVGLGGGQVSVG